MLISFFKRYFLLLCLLGVISPCVADNTIIPEDNGLFYYQLGGGQDVPLPAFYQTEDLPINVGGNVGLGFNCGAFNPTAALTNALNNMQDSFLAVQTEVLDAATSAITEFPLYELSRADPNLYNLITDAMAGVQGNIALATKSCETMQSQIAAGGDPYAHFAQVSNGNQWQQEIGTAEDTGNGDITQAQTSVGQTGGTKGIPWVSTNMSDQLGDSVTYAGGEGQPPIKVVHDTIVSGYNVIIQDGNPQMATTHHHHQLADNSASTLQSVWPTAEDAASWVTSVVGEQVVTTYNDGPKSSQPGVGLYPDIEKETETLEPQLANLVSGATPLTITNLQAISPPGIGISPNSIEQIQHLDPVDQQNALNLLAQNVAALTVIQKVSLALRLFEAGRKVPAIYANQPAQKMLAQAMAQLRQQVSDMLLFKQAQERYAITPMSALVQYGHATEAKQTGEAALPENPPIMEDGAISSNSTSSH